jgi:hypothetical protein
MTTRRRAIVAALAPRSARGGQIGGHRLVRGGQGLQAATRAEAEEIAPAGGVSLDRAGRFGTAGVVLDALGGLGELGQYARAA